MRNLLGLVVLGLVFAACSPARSAPQPGSGNRLYEAMPSRILVVGSRSHQVERTLPLGTPSGDWKHLYSIIGTSLVDTDPLTGDTQNTMALGGAYQLPPATSTGLPGGLSPAGWWLVVQSQDASKTRMLIIDTLKFRVADTVELNGKFNFDAISDDGGRLYLIQYLNGKEYYVRLFDVSLDRLDANIVVDKSDGNQAMTGRRLSGIAAPDGSILFSMYVRESESPFIHALNLSGPFAFCLDLPGSGVTTWSLAMARDGSRLYAIGGATGVVAELDTSNQFSPQILRTAQLPPGADAAVLTADGKTLVTAGSSGVMWVDTQSFRVRMQTLAEWKVWSLALSPDGKTLYAVNEAGQVAQISMASGEVVSRFDGTGGRPLSLMRVAAS
jgi:hypothetical protein